MKMKYSEIGIYHLSGWNKRKAIINGIERIENRLNCIFILCTKNFADPNS